MQETQKMRVWSLGQEDPLEGEIPIHPSILVENFMDKGAWWAPIHEITKEFGPRVDMNEISKQVNLERWTGSQTELRLYLHPIEP